MTGSRSGECHQIDPQSIIGQEIIVWAKIDCLAEGEESSASKVSESQKLRLLFPVERQVSESQQGFCRDISRLLTGDDGFDDRGRQERERQPPADLAGTNVLACGEVFD